jgi:hypothetical protein
MKKTSKFLTYYIFNFRKVLKTYFGFFYTMRSILIMRGFVVIWLVRGKLTALAFARPENFEHRFNTAGC